MTLKNKLGWPIIIFLSITPLIPWYLALLPISYRFYNLYGTFISFGQISGLVGLMMFAITLVLSARLSAFEDFFGGMNRVYIAHHILGGISLILLLLHPLFLAFARITISWHEAAVFLIPGEDIFINLGIIGLLTMIILLLLTFFIKIPYHIWRFTHKFLGPVFIISAIHGLYVQSDIKTYMPLKIYILIIIGICMLAYLYRTILGRFFVRRTKYSVTNVSVTNQNITEIGLSPLGKHIQIIPGQFIFVYFLSKTVSKETHPFSINAVNEDGTLNLAAKIEGDYTKTLPNLQAGDIAVIEGGYGRFNYSLYKNTKQVWIAGGIGIVPFLSMAQHLTDPTYEIMLYYSVRTPDEAVYIDTLNSLSASNPKLQIKPCYSKTMGRLSAEQIARDVSDIKVYDFFLCGPPPMMKSMKKQLQKLGIKSHKIHSEEFSL